MFRNTFLCVGILISVAADYTDKSLPNGLIEIQKMWLYYSDQCIRNFNQGELGKILVNRIIKACPEVKGRLPPLVEGRRTESECLDNYMKEFEEKIKNEDFLYCPLACAIKKTNLLNDRGMFNPYEMLKLAELYRNVDKGMTEKLRKASTICVTVNAKEVSDGTRGCGRAKLLQECFRGIFGTNQFSIYKV